MSYAMASCGYPYYVSGEVGSRDALLATPAGVVRDPGFFAGAKGVAALVNTEVTAIDRKKHTVAWKNLQTGETGNLPYDKLVLATGAKPRMPAIPGRDLSGVATLASLEDADKLRALAAANKGKKAVIVGGGLIGMRQRRALRFLHLACGAIQGLGRRPLRCAGNGQDIRSWCRASLLPGGVLADRVYDQTLRSRRWRSGNEWFLHRHLHDGSAGFSGSTSRTACSGVGPKESVT